MNAVAMMTPEPEKNWPFWKETDSSIAGEKWITRERRATTGKMAAKEPVVQMMKREATRRPWKEVSPPPEPQLRRDMLRGRECILTR